MPLRHPQCKRCRSDRTSLSPRHRTLRHNEAHDHLRQIGAGIGNSLFIGDVMRQIWIGKHLEQLVEIECGTTDAQIRTVAGSKVPHPNRPIGTSAVSGSGMALSASASNRSICFLMSLINDLSYNDCRPTGARHDRRACPYTKTAGIASPPFGTSSVLTSIRRR